MSSFPSAYSGFIPTAEASLRSNFSTNPSRFPLNKYVKVSNVDKPSFYALVLNPDEEIRLNYTDGKDMLWVDGTDPEDNFSKGWDYQIYNATRWRKKFTIGDVAAETATWNIVADHANGATMNLMVNRVQQVHNVLGTGANWGSSTGTATALGGGHWNAGGGSNPNYIQIGLQAAISSIMLATNGMVTIDDLVLVINPTIAFAITQSTEYRDYLAHSPDAKDFLNNGTGYPPSLYGVKVVVEPTPKNTAKKGATRAAVYVAGNYAVLMARPDALIGDLNTMSTLTLGMFKDISLILKHDELALLTRGVAYDFYAPILRAPTGYLITSIL